MTDENIKSIDITPTWISLVDVLVEVAGHAKTDEARTFARDELRRMARLADRFAAGETAYHSPDGHNAGRGSVEQGNDPSPVG